MGAAPIFPPFFLALVLVTTGAEAQTAGEERFFAHCPRRERLHLHDERRALDLHTLLYTAVGMAELEVWRVADWLIDLPLPGPPRAPFQRTTRAVRSGYNRLPPWRVRQRVGELVDALQLAELSLGDAAATYSAATGDVAGPGSGMLVRVHKLIDWVQHVTGDLNRLSGRMVGRPHGLIPGTLPERAVAGGQWLFIKAFNQAGILTARALDAGLTTVELAGESVVNLGHRRPHQHTTVFLRLPMAAYRAHEVWILEHQARLVLGTAEEFARSTHAALTHRRRPATLAAWSRVERLAGEPEVVVMTTTRVLSRAAGSLAAYVVPAAWVLNDDEVPLTRAGAASKLPDITQDPDPDALHVRHQ